jgi:hypothetical protein
MDDEEKDINEEEVSRSQKETSELAVLSILWWRQNVDDLQEDLAKFDYKLNLKVKIVKHPFFCLPAWTMYRDLAKFRKFWSKYYYWKFQKKLDFSTFHFEYSFLTTYS